MRANKIRMTVKSDYLPGFKISGWLDGKRTYLWFGEGERCITYLEGQKLYRLAKAIVRQFEKTL